MLRRRKQGDDAPSVHPPAGDASKPAPSEDRPLKNPAGKLGEILIGEGIITAGQLNEALEKKQADGGFLGQNLIELGYITPETLTTFLVKQCKIPHINLLDYQIDTAVVSLIDPELCEEFGLVPIDKMGKILTLAMVDPLDIDALSAVRAAAPDLKIKPILCNLADFQIVFTRLFPDRETPGEPGQTATVSNAELGLGKAAHPSAPKAAEQRSPAKPEASKAAAPPAGDGPATAAATAATGWQALDPNDVSAAFKQSLAAAFQEFIPLLRNELATNRAPQSGHSASGDAPREAAGATPALEQRLDQLADGMRRLVESSELLKAAREQELKQIAAAADQEQTAAQSRVQHSVRAFPSATTNEGDASVLDGFESGTPLSVYTLAEFLPGPVNAYTYDLAKAVAAAPGKDYNPLYISGGVGLGKTHLINAIGNAIASSNGKLRAGYTSASRFAAHLADAAEHHCVRDFREIYCAWDVLILDDVQFIAGEIDAQEEFFHIFNSLQNEGRQIILAADKAPERLGLLEKRLVSRFDSGIVAYLKPPDWETRVAILRQHAKKNGIQVPDEVLALLAMRVTDDIRKLSGGLLKLIAYSKVNKVPISLKVAADVLVQLGVEAA